MNALLTSNCDLPWLVKSGRVFDSLRVIRELRMRPYLSCGSHRNRIRRKFHTFSDQCFAISVRVVTHTPGFLEMYSTKRFKAGNRPGLPMLRDRSG
jgi:hypothetical protein